MGKLDRFLNATALPVLAIDTDGFLKVTMELVVIEHQTFFLNLLCRVGHIAFMGFLHTNDKADIATFDEDFLELATSFLVLQTVDGEDLLDICLSQCQCVGNRRELLLELALVKENENT